MSSYEVTQDETFRANYAEKDTMSHDCMPGLSVIVPVYNSAEMLPELSARLEQVFRAADKPFELILVNDGSRDRSWEVIQELAEKKPWIRGLCMMRNYGQHNALLAGIRAAKYDVAVTMDDDLQHPPEELPRLLAAMTDNVDVVYGATDVVPHGFWRGLASKLTKWSLKHALSVDAARHVSAFRVFRTELRRAFDQFHSPFVSIDVLLTWATTRFAAVPVRHQPRAAGASNYGFRQLLRHAITLMTGFSVWPLQVASMIGFIATALGGLVLAYVLGRYFLEASRVEGFAFLASIITIFAGAQLFALGIIGEYLARMHFRMLDRPPYVVAREVKEPAAGASN
jgi:glycosyltransferase involved in cell wall biosynthesis